MEKSKKKTGIIVFAVIIITVIVTAIIGFLGAAEIYDNSSYSNIRTVKKTGKDFIAALYIEGVIEDENKTYNQTWLLDTIKQLKEDKRNRGIALFINSPGGLVYESDEVYLALQNYKTAGKPVYAYQGQLAASGGYYISCAADKIYANRNTLTGSIGVRQNMSIDMSNLMDRLGIKQEEIISGKNKNMFNLNVPVTDEQRAIAQSIADDAYDQFIGIVAMQRNIPLFEVKKLADGRIYTANQALHNNLIDAIGSWDNMIEDMFDNEFDEHQYRIKTYRYDSNMPLYKTLLCRSALKHKSIGKIVNSITNIYNKELHRRPAYIYSY